MLVLTKKELKALTDCARREKQMQQLTAWGIPFETTLTGGLKVLRADVRFAGNATHQEGPRYEKLA
jgi:hypothetical protein